MRPHAAKVNRGRQLVFLALPAALWVWLGWQLHDEWSLNSQYNYGWAVPLLAGLLFYRRWVERPALRSGQSVRSRWLQWILLFGLLPLRLIGEANPDWRALDWALAATVVGYSLWMAMEIGGGVWLRHFAVPICFTLVAVPWPVRFENWIVQWLTHTVASLAVESAGWLGIGAYQLGNVIQLASGFVGVDEACSGVRTLQAAIMVSVFLGELLLLRPWRRCTLVALGCFWVFACNVVRATTLVFIAARSGIPALERWHDLVGSIVMVAGVAGIGLAAFALQRPSNFAADDAGGDRAIADVSIRRSLAGCAWLLVIFTATEIWYRAHEDALIPQMAWTFEVPETLGARPLPIPETTREILHYNSATSAVWRGDAGTEWWGFFARWEAKRSALQLVRSHSPDICLPAVGRTFLRRQPDLEIARGELRLLFSASEFLQEGQPLFVFVCIQADRTAGWEQADGGADFNIRSRLRAVWRGERNLGQRLLELAVTGVPDYVRARAAAVRVAEEIIQPIPTD